MEHQENTHHPKISGFLKGVFTGFILAGLILVLINFYLNARSTDKDLTTSQKTLALSITSPDTNLAVSQKELQVEGKTGRDGIVTITTDTETKTLETKNALFSTKLSLREGLNIIHVVAFDPQTGESQTTNRQILYLEDELTNL